MPKAPYVYIINPLPANGLTWVGLLDMLRYDNCTVWTVSTDYAIIHVPHPATLARWESFGLYLTEKT